MSLSMPGGFVSVMSLTRTFDGVPFCVFCAGRADLGGWLHVPSSSLVCRRCFGDGSDVSERLSQRFDRDRERSSIW